MVGVLREAGTTYEAGQCKRGIAAVMAIGDDGALTVWCNPAYVFTEKERSLVETWVRLQIIRGRRSGYYLAEQIVNAPSCNTVYPSRAIDDAPAS